MSEKAVLYIGSMARSGSTLVSNLIGQTPGCFNVGELHYFFDRGLRDNWKCGCGSTFNECEFWRRVTDRVRRKLGEDKLATAVDVIERVRRRGHSIPILLRTRIISSEYKLIRQYRELFVHVYDAIFEVSGAAVIVDSSKEPHHLAIMGAGQRDWCLWLIHLTRDSRAVAYSQKRKKENTNVTSAAPAFMVRRPAVVTGLIWIRKNILLEIAAGLADNSMRLNYSRFVEQPSVCLQEIQLFAKRPPRPLSFLLGHEALMQPAHVFSGNPSRFESKERLTIRADDEWRSRMSLWNRMIVYILTAPLNAIYRKRYPLGRNR